METGIKLIAIERQEQIEKHYRLIRDDVKWNTEKELSKAAIELLKDNPKIENMPTGWQGGIINKAINNTKNYSNAKIHYI